MANFNFNKVILGGRLTSDPEFKTTPSGLSVVSFGIAVNRKHGKDGEETPADFFRVQAWRGTAEFVQKFFRKSSAICIMGHIETRSWVDQQGKKQFATEIVAEEVYFVDSKSDVQSFAGAAPVNAAGVAPAWEPLGADDELPFGIN